jgi:hypothetical protein
MANSISAKRDRRRLAALAVCVVLIASCGGGTEPQDRGSFQASVTGSVTETVEGGAGFTDIAGEWALHLLPNTPEEGWQFLVRLGGPRPGAGTLIQIVRRDPGQPPPAGEASGDVARLAPAGFDYWVLSGGFIGIGISTPSRMSGSFQLSAEPLFSDGRGPIAVTGTFEAIFMREPPGERFRP